MRRNGVLTWNFLIVKETTSSGLLSSLYCSAAATTATQIQTIALAVATTTIAATAYANLKGG